ncbi:MAG TPA: addiction module protein [Pyrinomonadaceae bacterium]|nr:addiction module protein [Pyrinomonadaceae bacterium]
MTIEQVETEALKLDPQARAKLAEKLLRSLDELSEKEIEQLWAEEALGRDAEIDSGAASLRDAEDVFRDARSRLT